MDAGQLYRKLRESKGLSQKVVADDLGVDLKKIQRIEMGGDKVKIVDLKVALRPLRATIGDLYQSKVPERYHDEGHQDLHEQLQEILESDGNLTVGIIVHIKLIHKELLEQVSKKARDNGGKIETAKPTKIGKPQSIAARAPRPVSGR